MSNTLGDAYLGSLVLGEEDNARYMCSKTKLKATADAIRTKLGTTTQYSLSDFPDAIDSIQTGGDPNARYFNFIKNRAIVTLYYEESNSNLRAQWRLAGAHQMLSIPNTSKVSLDCFTGSYINNSTGGVLLSLVNPSLHTINLSESGTELVANSGDQNALFPVYQWAKLKNINGKIANIGNMDFRNSSSLEYVDMSGYDETQPLLFSFYNCTKIDNIVLTCGMIGQWGYNSYGSFENCTGLTNITLFGNYMNSGIMAKMSNTFKGCTALESIYVPDDKVDAYKSSNYWSGFSDKFKPLSSKPI